MTKNRYVIKNKDRVEISVRDYRKYGDIINAYIADGFDGTGAYELGIYDTFDEAKQALEKYRCTYGLTSGFAGVKFYEADLYYIEEQQYNEDWDEWEPSGDYEFAEY